MPDFSDDGYRPVIQCCAVGMYWDQERLTCMKGDRAKGDDCVVPVPDGLCDYDQNTCKYRVCISDMNF